MKKELSENFRGIPSCPDIRLGASSNSIPDSLLSTFQKLGLLRQGLLEPAGEAAAPA